MDAAEALAGLATRLWPRLFAALNPDGGLPQTFFGDASACWTSAEIYAALASHPGPPAGAQDVVERLEHFLLGVWTRQGDGGLPYYEVPAPPESGPRSSLSVVDATAAFLIGWRVRHPAEVEVTMRTEAWLRGARASGPGSGWGFRPRDGAARTYSTTYALLALDPAETVADARALLGWQDPAGCWPFRPGAPASRLGTSLAIDALTFTRSLPATARARAEGWLLCRLAEPGFLDEDAFVSPEGYAMSFLYAPRLVVIGHLLRSVAERAAAEDDGVEGFACEADVFDLLEHLSVHVRAMSEAEAPCPDLRETRTWHFIELAWGEANVGLGLGALPNALRARTADASRQAWGRACRRAHARGLPGPLRGDAARLANLAGAPDDLARLLGSAVERSVNFSCILRLQDARARGDAEVVNRFFGARRQGNSDLPPLLGPSLGEPTQPSLATRLADQWRSVLASGAWKAVSQARNDAAHGRAPATGAMLAPAVAAWTECLEALVALRDVDLLAAEATGHADGTPGHLYDWVSWDSGERRGRSWIASGLVDTAHDGPRGLRGLFAADSRCPGAVPLPLFPLVASAWCENCVAQRAFVYSQHAPATARGDGSLFLRCSAECGNQLATPLRSVRPPS